MKFYKNLYVSDGLKKKKREIIRKLEKEEYPLSIYILAMIEEGENQLEFYSASMLCQEWFRDDGIFVVGIASGYYEAVYLVEEIAREVYDKTGDLDIRRYIREQEGQDMP